jgi:signal transduction histidine kinase
MNITLIYFIYGLAFFSMGIVMLLESARYPMLAEGRILLPLALFGFIHGIHEWFEIALINQFTIDPNTDIVNWTRIVILAISFILLFFFSVQVLTPASYPPGRELIITSIITILYLSTLFFSTRLALENHIDWYSHLDALTRYLLAVPAAFLAGLAFIRQGMKKRSQNQKRSSGMLYLVAFGFIGYAFTQTVVPPIDTIPGNIWNSDTFFELTGVPVQLLRAILALVITISLVRVSQLTASERRKQLRKSEIAHLAALEQVQIELEAKEKIRSELMHRTVVAQEEERARIARELHDETSQLLAAISLQLESLRNSVQTSDIGRQVDELQVLRRRVADGIYRLMNDLRPAQLDDLGLTAALRSLVDDTQRHMGVCVELRVAGEERRLNSFAETVLFRVAQESLTNVARHAAVSEATITITYNTESVKMNILDQGKGFSLEDDQVSPHGWGLIGMQERVEAAKGQIEIKSSPSYGTTITAIIPTDEEVN